MWNVVDIGQCWICAVLWKPFLKMATARNFSMSGIYLGHHNLPTNEMSLKLDNVEFVGIVAAILKMATARKCSMSGINSVHHNLPIYQI